MGPTTASEFVSRNSIKPWFTRSKYGGSAITAARPTIVLGMILKIGYAQIMVTA